MDRTEPETERQEENIRLGHKLAIGSGNRYVNAYPLLATAAVHDGQRGASDEKGVYILSRSASCSYLQVLGASYIGTFALGQ